jgi:hypothetical protein
VHRDTWIDYALNGTKCDVAIITDLRFRNEAEILLKNGATLVEIRRPGIARGTDPAEVDLANWTQWNYLVNNDGSLSDLNSKIKIIAEDLGLLK